MKKILLICFLALLCLAGSQTQAKVASPRDSLVDNPGPQGQEESIPSARVGEGNAQAVIWGRVSEYGDRSHVQVQVYPEYFFASSKSPGANLVYVPLKTGNLMEGAYPKDKSFQYNLETKHAPQWISLSLGESKPFLDRYRIDPGDSIQVFLNLETNSLAFAGHSAEKFKLQQALAQVETEFLAQTNPVLWTQNPERVLSNPTYLEQLEQAKSAAGPVLSIRSRNLEALTELRVKDIYQSGGLLLTSWERTDAFQGKVPEEFLTFFKKEVELREWKKYFDQIKSHLLFALREGKDSLFLGNVMDLARESIRKSETFLELDVNPYSSSMVDFLATKTHLLASIKMIGRIDAAGFIGEPFWKEKFLVRYFYESFDYIPKVEEQLALQLSAIKTPRFRQSLETLQHLKGSGSLVSGFEFLDENGQIRTFKEVAQGDLILVEFWITGCKACLAFNESTLKEIKDKFGSDPRFQVISVSADFNAELWKTSLGSGKYTQDEFTNLYTGELNRNHPFLLKYGISSFPNRLLIDGEGKFVQTSQVPFLASDLIPLIENYLNQLNTKPNTTL